MKQFLSFVLLAALIVSLAACGGAVVDYDTPKSGELSAAYDFYRDSQASFASGMAITPEQADDGTEICFPGSMYYVAQYGKQDTDGGILEVIGTITLDKSGGYTYEPGE